MDRSFKWITKSCTAYSTEEPWQVRNPAPNSEKSCEANGSNSQIPDRNFIRPNRPHPPTSHLNKTAKRNGNTKEPENWCRIERVIFRCHKNHTSNGVIFVVTGQGLGAPLNHLDKSDQLGKSYWHRKTWKKTGICSGCTQTRVLYNEKHKYKYTWIIKSDYFQFSLQITPWDPWWIKAQLNPNHKRQLWAGSANRMSLVSRWLFRK